MSLLPSTRLATLRALRLSCGSNFAKTKAERSCLIPQHKAIVQSSAGIAGKAKYEEWPKPAPWDYENKLYWGRHAWYEGTLKRFDENTKVIIVDGLPGIGKEELAKQLAEEFNMRYFPGATLDYKYITGYGFDLRTLDPKLPPSVRSYDEKSFLKNPKDKRLLNAEIDLLFFTYSQYVDALTHLFNTGQGVVLTRNPFTHLAFVEGCVKAGYLSRYEVDKAYKQVRRDANIELLRPHLILYLDTPISMVHEKMRSRGLGEEKIMTKEFLQTMEDWYKTKFLKDIEVHSDVLIYDWSEPGDFEVLVEDIERIDFDRFEKETRHPKFKDWRFDEDILASEARWKYTSQKMILMQRFRLEANDCPSLMFDQDDLRRLQIVYHAAPGYKFFYGFNPDQGDNVWLKTKSKYPSVEQNTNVVNYVP